MDGQQEAHCISILSDEIQQGKTFVVVTHKPSLLPLVDRIIVIAQHQVVMDGPRDEILAKMGARRVTDVTPIRAA
jgi:ATP-binding cassette subfamily C protein LapB